MVFTIGATVPWPRASAKIASRPQMDSPVTSEHDNDSSEQITTGKLVEFTYRIVDENGEVKEQVDLPLTYIHGHDSGMFPTVERALEGKRPGDSVSVELPPAEGFGERDPDLLFEDALSNVPAEYRKIGAEAEFRNDQGDTKVFRVTSMKNGRITLDGNHPLAGQTVTFHINILGVRDATDDELSGKIPTGHAAPLPTDSPPTLN